MTARGVRKRPLAAGISALLLVVVAFVAAIALDQPSGPHRDTAQTGSAPEASELSRVFMSELTSRLDALSRAELAATSSGSAHPRSSNHVRGTSGGARAHASLRNRAKSAGMSRGSGSSTPLGGTSATGQFVSHETSGADGGSVTTAAAEAPAQSTPVQQASTQQTPEQQTSTQQPVHYQPPSQPAGPAGLGSQVGGNCNPKCS